MLGRYNQIFNLFSFKIRHEFEYDQRRLFFSLYSQVYPLKAYWSRDAPTDLTFNNCKLCPHCIYVFCIYLRTNSDLCRLQHKLIGFYNRDEKCLHRGTDWGFK